MKTYWDKKEKRLVFDLEGEEIEGDFTGGINKNPLIINGIFNYKEKLASLDAIRI